MLDSSTCKISCFACDFSVLSKIVSSCELSGSFSPFPTIELMNFTCLVAFWLHRGNGISVEAAQWNKDRAAILTCSLLSCQKLTKSCKNEVNQKMVTFAG